MFESLGLENWTPQSASLVVGAIIGLGFGMLAQRSRFCLRRAVVGDRTGRSAALGLWVTALLTAIISTQSLVFLGVLNFSDHRFLASEVALPAILLGGLLFGTGMVLARGCASRLTVLMGSGNLRAFVTIAVFAIIAHAALKGVLAPARVWISSLTIEMGGATSILALPGPSLFWVGLVVFGLSVFVYKLNVHRIVLGYGILIGALVPLGWFATGVLLFDEFDPIVFESLAFTSASSETLFWTVAGTAIAPAFGVGLFLGTISGSAIAAITTSEFKWTGFNESVPTSRYLFGGSLMGVGGVLAGGCTVGAGLSGVSTLSFAAILSLLSIIIGALVTDAVLNAMSDDTAVVPAE